MKINLRFSYGYVIVILSFVIMVLILGAHYTYGVFFKPIISEFNWTRAGTSGAFSLAWLISGIAAIGFGALNDRIGPRAVLTLCGIFAGIGLMLVSQINALWQLYIVYGVIYGIGMSIFVPLTSTVAGWFIQRRTLMTGIVVAGIGVGTIVGPPIADLLIITYEWRESYLILGSVVLGVVVIAAQFLKSSPSRVNKQIKGENDLTKEESKTARNWFTLKEAITTGQFWMTFSQFICFGFCQSFIVVHIVPHVTDLGISSNYAASVLSTIGALSIVSKIAMGAVGDAIGNKRAFILGFILASLSLAWVMFTKEIWGFYLFAILFGIAYGTHISQQSPFAALLFGLPSHGVIFGVLALGMAVGATLGPIITGYLFDITGNYDISIMLSILLSVVGLILTILLKPILQKDT